MTWCLLVLFLTLAVSLGNSQSPPIISVIPPDATVEEGGNVTIKCDSGSGNLPVDLRANGEDVTVANEPRLIDETLGNNNNRTFTLTDITPEDGELNFTCFVGTFGLSSEIVFLTVLTTPNISTIKNGIGPEGGSANVTFTVNANPAIVKSGIRVTPMMPDSTSIDGSTVTLTYDGLQEAVSYNLYVNNSVGSATGMFTIDVYDFTNNGGDVEVTTGQPLTINCSVSESSPNIVESVTISGDNITEMMNVPDNDGSRVFTVTNAVTSQYNGSMYTCTARNGGTMTSITYTVTVVQPPIIPTTTKATMSSTLSIEPSSLPTTVTVSISPTSSAGSGLSTGAIAGIAVGAILFGIILIIAGVLLLAFAIVKRKDSEHKA